MAKVKRILFRREKFFASPFHSPTAPAHHPSTPGFPNRRVFPHQCPAISIRQLDRLHPIAPPPGEKDFLTTWISRYNDCRSG